MITRARALLGTLVSIRTDGDENAVSGALALVEQVQRLMSAHSDDSDLARINRLAHARAVSVHPWTFRVLRTAQAVSCASGGAFDAALGHGASWRDVELLQGGKVRLARRARLDLGGIAKGFAVDLAVAALQRRGASQGSVNAGGDLAVFGKRPQLVRVRVPGDPRLAVPLARTCARAFATSGSYFNDELVDGRDRRRLRMTHSITVSARSCMVADALTKAVAALGPQRALLERFAAHAYLVDRHGTLHTPRA
ncbi:MAG TPA: FAD:protein FMN transferase [Burkholderiales bacterium]|jgi:thiamine biosynthesis lipoprotein|nr:FAD:protein FMN transferase [Burkholderiales bacterium]